MRKEDLLGVKGGSVDGRRRENGRRVMENGVRGRI